MSAKQARMMLNKVRKLVNEHRQTSAFHHSEKNPAYLKLMMMERVLTTKVNETPTVAVGSTAGATQNQKDSTSGMEIAVEYTTFVLSRFAKLVGEFEDAQGQDS
jgi:hypothetical protein